MSEIITGSASVTILRPPGEVFDTIADITRMGDWSPECTAGRWVDGATGPAMGAKFEGDNKASLGPVTVKSWTTTSEVTAFEPGQLFEFVAEEHTTWRYEFEEVDGGTLVTESVSYSQFTGWQKFLYVTVMRRDSDIVKGMNTTLGRIKTSLEA